MENGSFLYKNSDNILILFLYIKMGPDKLKKVLPLSYDKFTMGHQDYFIVFFKKGVDYLGCASYSEIQQIIQDNNAIDIINNDYINVNNKINIQFKEFQRLVNFSRAQFLNI